MTTWLQIRAHCHKIWSKKLDPNNPITAAVPHKLSRQNYCSDEENLTRSLLSRMCRGRICWWAVSCRWPCPPPPPPTPSPRPPAPPSRPASTSGHLKQGSLVTILSCGRHIFRLFQKHILHHKYVVMINWLMIIYKFSGSRKYFLNCWKCNGR